MASPLQSGKQRVNLASRGPRVSRIRRDPPPVVKPAEVRDPKEVETRVVVVGVVGFALAFAIILMGLGSWSGWTPGEYTLQLGDPPPSSQRGD